MKDIYILKRNHSLTAPQVQAIRTLMHIGSDPKRVLPIAHFGFRVNSFIEKNVRELSEFAVHPRKPGDVDYFVFTEYIDYCMLQVLGHEPCRTETEVIMY